MFLKEPSPLDFTGAFTEEIDKFVQQPDSLKRITLYIHTPFDKEFFESLLLFTVEGGVVPVLG